MSQKTRWEVIPVERNTDVLPAVDLQFHLQRLSDASAAMEVVQIIPESHGWIVVMRSKA